MRILCDNDLRQLMGNRATRPRLMPPSDREFEVLHSESVPGDATRPEQTARDEAPAPRYTLGRQAARRVSADSWRARATEAPAR